MSTFDLSAYLDRIGLPGQVGDATAETLRALHEAHLAAVPFENVDVRLGRRISLDLGDLQDKMVSRRRGGYCFEQNTLFAAALRSLGFEVTTLEARVRPPGATALLPRTHMTLRVKVGSRSWLADVGFGGDGPLHPVPLDGTVSEQPLARFAVAVEEGDIHVLRTEADGTWRDLYAFGLRPAHAVDYEVANHYTSTYSRSPFVNMLTVQSTTAQRRIALRGRKLTLRRPEGGEAREMEADEVVELLRDDLGLDLSSEEIRTALG